MKKQRFDLLFVLAIMIGVAVLSIWPEDLFAKRIGGGSSIGSRGTRSFSTPRQSAPPSSATTASRESSTPSPSSGSSLGGMQNRPGMSSGLLGGVGGLLLGGLIGSMLFGGSGAGIGGGIGLLDILVIGGLLWFALRWFKNQQAASRLATNPAQRQGYMDKENFAPLEESFSSGGGVDEVSQGLAHMAAMDSDFNSAHFLVGAKNSYRQIQGAWSDWSVERLKPLLTEGMWEIIQRQALERKGAGQRDIIEKIQFNQAYISEAWQESGEEWLTVCFDVQMVDYVTDVAGKLVEGDPDTLIQVVEYWTFTRPVGSRNPNWKLAAIQQPGEVARSTS
ncbi:MAG: Tim44 domain-containing protein [Magnetococcus sp. DMHC-6]